MPFILAFSVRFLIPMSATLDSPDENAQGSKPWGGFGGGANSPRYNARAPRAHPMPHRTPEEEGETPESLVPFPLVIDPLGARLRGIETGARTWRALIVPAVQASWPVEMFSRFPAQTEILRRWNATFSRMSFGSVAAHYEEGSPAPYRARRVCEESGITVDLFLPQIGGFLNAGFDAKPPDDCAHWQADVCAFCASFISLIQHELALKAIAEVR